MTWIFPFKPHSREVSFAVVVSCSLPMGLINLILQALTSPNLDAPFYFFFACMTYTISQHFYSVVTVFKKRVYRTASLAVTLNARVEGKRCESVVSQKR